MTAVATFVAVATRVAANADQPTLAESLAAISENRAIYGAGGVSRLVAGVALIGAAWFLYRTRPDGDRLSGLLAPLVFVLSGLFTAISGVGAIALAAGAPAPPDSPPETTAYLRSLTGKIGFALAGLALVLDTQYQWKMGRLFRYTALASAVLGVLMQFIWWDAATLMHRITGVAFLLWLIVAAGLLLRDRPRPESSAS